MASAEMSLEDIIRKKRIPPARRGRGGFRGGLTRPQFKQINMKQDRSVVNINRGGFNGNRGKTAVVGDARNKIILKNRTKIADARDKLAEIAKQRDARVKLDSLKMKKGLIGVQIMNQKGKPRLRRGFTDITRQVRPSPIPPPHSMPHHNPLAHRMDVDMSGYDMDVDMEDEYVPPPMKIVRSINNNLSRYLPPPPDFPTALPPKRPLRDKTVLSNRQAGFNLTVVAKNNDVSRKKSSKASTERSHRLERPRSPPTYYHERSPQPVSILKKRPSMAPPPRPSSIPSSPSSSGYRILVSNLQSSVTASDIHELFGDIGELLDSRLVRPGTAEVIYHRLEDAQKAVDVYHNRQLDGQPMNCFLVNPRNPQASSSASSSRSNPSSKSRSGASLPASSNSSVVPDVSTFYKVLFGKD